MFCGSAVGIGRGARDVAFLFEALAEFLIGPANMLTEYVAACGFIPAQVAWGTLPELSPDFVPPGRGSGRARAARGLRWLAGNRRSDQQQRRNHPNWKSVCHSAGEKH